MNDNTVRKCKNCGKELSKYENENNDICQSCRSQRANKWKNRIFAVGSLALAIYLKSRKK